MAEYLTYEEYKAKGFSNAEEAEFSPLRSYASRIIDAYTFNAIRRYDLMADEYYADMIKDAVALEIDMLALAGGVEAVAGLGNGSAGAVVASESEAIGNYSHSISYDSAGAAAKAKGDGQVYANGVRIAPLAISLLAPIRAMGRQVRLC